MCDTLSVAYPDASAGWTSSSEPFSRSVLIKRFLSHLGRTTQGTHSDVSGGIKPSFPAAAVGGDDGLT